MKKMTKNNEKDGTKDDEKDGTKDEKDDTKDKKVNMSRKIKQVS